MVRLPVVTTGVTVTKEPTSPVAELAIRYLDLDLVAAHWTLTPSFVNTILASAISASISLWVTK